MTASADILAAGEICGIHFKNNEEGWCHVVDEDDHGDRTLNRVSYKNGFSLLSHASLSFLVPICWAEFWCGLRRTRGTCNP